MDKCINTIAPCFSQKNPLDRRGVNQEERMTDALRPDKIRIDDRSTEELLYYAYQLAGRIKYFNLNNRHEEEQQKVYWNAFFEFDLSYLTILASENLEALEKDFAEKEEKFLSDREAYRKGGTIDDPDPKHFRIFIDFIYHRLALKLLDICNRIAGNREEIKRIFYKEVIKIIEDEVVRAILDDRIQNGLIQLIGFDKGNPEPSASAYPETGADSEQAVANFTNDYSAFIYGAGYKDEPCRRVWGVNQLCFDCITADNSYNHERIRKLFQVFFKALVSIQVRADYHLKNFLSKERAHLPHMSLFLTFLNLFEYARRELNGLSTKHLDFYYKQILCIDRRPAEEDKVHVLFSLAKNFDSYLVPKGSRFKGGKDALGKTRIYELTDELVVNKARVGEVKTLFVNEDLDTPGEYLRVYAAEDARKADGREEDFADPDSAGWSPLGGRHHSPGMESPSAQLGFALASPIFMLEEGTREVFLTLHFDGSVLLEKETEELSGVQKLSDHFYRGLFRLEIGSGEAWTPIVETATARPDLDAQFQVELLPEKEEPFHPQNNPFTRMKFAVAFSPSFDPIAPFRGEQTYNADWPVFRLSLVNDGDQDNYAYAKLRDLSLLDIDIAATVSGVQNLVVENDNAVLDPSKEFYPFGNNPKTGSALFVGNQEVFSKQLTSLTVDLEWAGLPGSSFSQYYEVYERLPEISDSRLSLPSNSSFQLSGALLEDKAYQLELRSADPRMFDCDDAAQPESKRAITFGRNAAASDDYINRDRRVAFQPPEQFTARKAKWGFLRLQLEGADFLHDYYTKILTLQSLELGSAKFIAETEQETPDEVRLPNAPYTPVIKSLSLNYASKLTIDLTTYDDFKKTTQEIEKLFFVTPFGYRTLDLSREIEKTGRGIPFLPQFAPPEMSVPLGASRVSKGELLYESWKQPSPPTRDGTGSEEKKLIKNPDHDQLFPNSRFLAPKHSRLKKGVTQRGNNIDLSVLKFGTPPSGIFKPTPVHVVLPELLILHQKKGRKPVTYSPEEAVNLMRAGRRIDMAEGNLFIGIKDLVPGQNLSLLMQMLEGSGDPEFAPPGIEWSYLKGNEWYAFTPDQILSDTTKPDPQSNQSLNRSGIIRFAIPRAISSRGTTMFNPECLWIRASTVPADVETDLPESPAALPLMVDIRTQAAEAVFVNEGNKLDHLESALPPNSISGFVVKEVGISKVEQPFSSFGGRPEETSEEYYRRVNERLRHKDRGITVWDLERLVLEEFPEIYKVKCLNHTSGNSEIHPGHVTVAVIPNFRNNNNLNPLEPRAHLGLLGEIERYLQLKTNLFLSNGPALRVVSPSYEEIRVACCVRFRAGKDENYYQSLLNTELKQLLAPWAPTQKTVDYRPAEIVFGTRVHRAFIQNFIEERDYVDVISRFALLHYDRNRNLVPYYDEAGNQLAPEQVEEIIPTTSLSILTSYEKKSRGEKIPFAYDHLIYKTSRTGQTDGDAICLTCP